MQSLLWDLVASSVPWDVQPPAEGKLSAHETLAKTVLLLVLASPGISTLAQVVLKDCHFHHSLACTWSADRVHCLHCMCTACKIRILAVRMTYGLRPQACQN